VSAAVLRELGHDAAHVRDHGLGATEDEVVLAFACAHDMVLVTANCRDYRSLHRERIDAGLPVCPLLLITQARLNASARHGWRGWQRRSIPGLPRSPILIVAAGAGRRPLGRASAEHYPGTGVGPDGCRPNGASDEATLRNHPHRTVIRCRVGVVGVGRMGRRTKRRYGTTHTAP
jgi:hypothetical protein